MKVIFLDFDGVLNSRRFRGTHSEAVDESRLHFLRELVSRTGAEIVLSTSWREHWDCSGAGCDVVGREIDRVFSRYGLEILGKTPSANRDRALEIQLWLEAHPETESFVILDDSPFGWGAMSGRLVRTDDRRDGLDRRSVEAAAALLNGRHT